MLYRRLSLCVLGATALLAQSAKRPLNHHDYDGWKSISSQRQQ